MTFEEFVKEHHPEQCTSVHLKMVTKISKMLTANKARPVTIIIGGGRGFGKLDVYKWANEYMQRHEKDK